MKKLLAMVLICCMLFSIAGCSTEKPETSTSYTPTDPPASVKLKLSKEAKKDLAEDAVLQQVWKRVDGLSATGEYSAEETKFKITSITDLPTHAGGSLLKFEGILYFYNDYGTFVKDGTFTVNVYVGDYGDVNITDKYFDF